MIEEYSEKDYHKEEKSTFKGFYWIIGVAVLAMIAAPILIHNLSNADNSTRGTFGDMFGMVNALFSGLAFGGVILAIMLQRLDLKIQRHELRNSIEQLKLQREEMELQRKEMQRTADELKGQRDILDRQNFEDKFFRLLSIYATTKSDLKYTVYRIVNNDASFIDESNLEHYSGKEAIAQIIKAVENEYYKGQSNLSLVYDYIYDYNIDELAHYFRSLYHIVNLVDKSTLLDKEFYLKILKANLSNSEILLLAFNGLHKYGEGFKGLIEQYKLLDNLILEFDKPERLRVGFVPEYIIEGYPHLKKLSKKQKQIFQQNQ